MTGDLLWEDRRDVPDDVGKYLLGALTTNNRNLAIYDRLIIDTSVDTHVFALDAEMVWETQVLDYHEHAAMQGAGPIIAGGKAVSGRSCLAAGRARGVRGRRARRVDGRRSAAAAPHPGARRGRATRAGAACRSRSARTSARGWSRATTPRWNLIYIGTSVTLPAPKFFLGGIDNQHLYHNSTLALDADIGEIRWYYQPGPETPIAAGVFQV